MKPRQIVYESLAGEHKGRVPRHLWVLPWAEMHHPEGLARIRRDFPDDIVYAPGFYKQPPRTVGDAYRKGSYLDEWGCTFHNVAEGIIGEVKEPLIADWNQLDDLRLPEELLTIDVDQVNRFCRATEQFVIGEGLPRPFERAQWLRGTENIMLDLSLRPREVKALIHKVHGFYLKQIELWCRTEVDAVWFMDDWGSQSSLLIAPDMWREFFRPCYRDYIELAHSKGKKAFFHSDGYITDIIPELIELGLDALNAQLFCMDIEELGRNFKGKITFWGEIDRQHLLPEGSLEDIRRAVIRLKENLYQRGGVIAQCEFGPLAKPENVYQVFKTWEEII